MYSSLDFFQVRLVSALSSKSRPTKTMKRGLLILIEGLDRTGKTTQTTLLFDKLKPNAELIKFPDRSTSIGQLIDKYLTENDFELPDQSVHLLFSANRWELSKQLQGHLLAGKHVVMDRYVYSGIAYSSAKETSGMDLEWCLQPDKGLIKPDLLFFLSNGDVSDTSSRRGFGNERYETLQFQDKVKGQFFNVFRALENYPKPNDRLRVLNVANCSIEKVAQEIWSIVQEKLAKEPPSEFTFF